MTQPGASFLLPANSLSVIRGASKTYQLTVTDENGASINLTGATVYFTVKKTIQDTEPLIQKKSTDITQINIVSPRAGIAQIFLKPADTATRDVGDYVFDVWVVLTTGKRYPVVPPTTFEIVSGVTVLL